MINKLIQGVKQCGKKSEKNLENGNLKAELGNIDDDNSYEEK